jgi:hypothetical protein
VIFQSSVMHRIDLTGKISLGSIPESKLYSMYRDGRPLGLMLAEFLTHHFENLEFKLIGDGLGQGVRDVIDGKRYQTRVITKLGCDLSRSEAKGKGRYFSEEGHSRHWSECIDGWFIGDVRFVPIVVCAQLPKEMMKPPARKITVNQWQSLTQDYRYDQHRGLEAHD